MSDSDDAGSSAPAPSLAATRTRREKKDKHGRMSALQKFKEAKAKGKKFNYEVDEVKNVYEMVDEREYAEEVEKKRGSAWLVEDEDGYFEDGREIFDDEEDDIYPSDKTAIKKKGDKAGSAAEKSRKEGVKGSNIKNMLLSMPAKKKKEEDIKLDDDEVLGDILGKIKPKLGPLSAKSAAASSPSAQPLSSRLQLSSEERNPFIKKGTGLKKPVTKMVEKMASEEEDQAPSKSVDPSPSQVIDDFDSCPMEGFDDDMDIGDFEETAEERRTSVPDSDDNADKMEEEVSMPNRGFIEQKASRNVEF